MTTWTKVLDVLLLAAFSAVVVGGVVARYVNEPNRFLRTCASIFGIFKKSSQWFAAIVLSVILLVLAAVVILRVLFHL